MRRALGIAACLLLAGTPAVLSATSGSSFAARPLRMTIGTVGPIGSLDPRHGDSTIAREVWNIQYPTLTALDPLTLDTIPGIADGWRPAPGGRGWIYSLRPGQRWTDGRPVTADDVVYSLDHARDGHWPYAAGLLDGLTARALDRRTVEIASARPGGVLPGLLLHIVPAHVYTLTADLSSERDRLGVADGAWHVVASSSGQVELDAVASPGPTVAQIVFRSYGNFDALLAALARGEVDAISGAPAPAVGRLENMPSVTVDHAPDGTQLVLSMTTSGPLRDVRVRRAVSLAIDRTALVTAAVDGVGTAGVVPLLARGRLWALDAETAQSIDSSLDAQPGSARRLLASAPRLVRPLTLATAPSAIGAHVGELVRAALAAVGISTRPATAAAPRTPPGPVADLTIRAVQIGDDPTTRLDQLVCDTCNALRARFRGTADLATRLDTAHEMLLRATQQATEVGLFQPDLLQAFRSDRLTGFLPAPEQRSLVVFGPAAQYGIISAAKQPRGEQLSNATHAIGAAVLVALCGLAYWAAARVRRRLAASS